MTEISFYFNVPGRVDYACRIARKIHRQGASLAVAGSDDALGEFDRLLWSFAPTEFVPHAWVDRHHEVPESLHGTTVWLARRPIDAPAHDALLNLGAEVPAGFETFTRLYEIVSTDPADRLAARSRWKSYADRGYAIRRHEIGGAA